MVYMLTFGDICGILMVNVTIYSSTMDPMGYSMLKLIMTVADRLP